MIGGVLGFSTFRQRPELIATVLISILYVGFAYKNQGAITATAEEREAVLAALKAYPADGGTAGDVRRLRDKLEPTLTEYDIAGARNFHIFCDVLTIAFLWAKEWRRRHPELVPAG